MEKRTLLAALLAGVFLILWYAVVSPPPKPTPAGPLTTPAASAGPTAPESPESAPAAPEEEQVPAVKKPIAVGVAEESVTLKGGAWTATVSNRGGVLTSLVLTKYKDEAGKPLDLVAAGERPLAMAAQGPWNEALYTVGHDGDAVRLAWSDGAGNWVEKVLRPGEGPYGLEVTVSAGGAAARGGVVVGTALPVEGAGASSRRLGRQGAVIRVNGSLKRVTKVKAGEERLEGQVEFAGSEDQYFLMVLLPEGTTRGAVVTGGSADALHVAVLGRDGVVAGTLFAGPKEHDLLVGLGRGLDDTLSFGLFGFMSVIFLSALRWIHGVVRNWGVAIVVLTAAIRLLLFPLTHKSTVAMRRMQKMKPKMDAIQERYKERAKKDPQVRSRMNQEMMNLYKQEGVNPMGGCLPMLVQLPILWALYTLFAFAIELRHAPFALWITDLSVKDPTYVLPILMTATMFIQQRITPQTGDPAQRRLFMMMPLIFGFMFMNFPAGLVLYWLTNNVLTIGQQLATERLLARAES